MSTTRLMQFPKPTMPIYLEILTRAIRCGQEPMMVLHSSGLELSKTLTFDIQTPCSQGSLPGISGYHHCPSQ